MNIHLCTESPCPDQDKESAKLLQSGFSTNVNDNEQHIEKCEKCRLEYFDREFHTWVCVPCDRTGWGLGCPNHAHEEDKSVLV